MRLKTTVGKTAFFAALCPIGLFMGVSTAWALPTVKSIEKISLDFPAEKAEISPDGTYVVVSSYADVSLRKVSTSTPATPEIQILSEEGRIYDLKFSPDSKTVAFRRDSYDSTHHRYQAYRSVDLDTRAESELVAPSRRLNTVHFRDLENVQAVHDLGLEMKTLAVSAERKQNVASVKKAISPAKAAALTFPSQMTAEQKLAVAVDRAESSPTAYIDRGDLKMVDANGETKTLNPNGDNLSYLWPGVSPDGTMVAYYLGGYGVGICDTEGHMIYGLYDHHAPRWLDDSTIIAMADYDDGKVITASSLVVMDLEGNQAQVTDDEMIAMYPSVDVTGTKVAFTNPMGELYIITFDK